MDFEELSATYRENLPIISRCAPCPTILKYVKGDLALEAEAVWLMLVDWEGIFWRLSPLPNEA